MPACWQQVLVGLVILPWQDSLLARLSSVFVFQRLIDRQTSTDHSFAVHILVIDHFTAFSDGVKLSCVQFLFAGLWSAVCIPFFEHVDAAALLSCALPLLYVGVFSCGVGYTLQILAQKDSNPTVVTILLSLESVFAVIAGAIILHQSMTPREYLGCVLMFLAVVLAQIPLPAKAARTGK